MDKVYHLMCCGQKIESVRTHYHCLHVTDHQIRISLISGFCVLRDVFPQVKKESSHPQRAELRGESLLSVELPDSESSWVWNKVKVRQARACV